MIFTLKVSALSYGILILEHPSHDRSGTIVASSHSLITKLLNSRKPDTEQSTEHLNKEIHISITKKINPTETDLIGVGLLLHEEHRYALMRWVQSSVAAGTTASYGIRSFMHHYDLDDDAVNQETVLRTWQRYVRTHVELLQRPKDVLLSAPTRAVVWDENTFAHFIADIVEYLYKSNGQWNDKRLSALRLTAYNSHKSVRKKIDPLGYNESTAYDAIKSTMRWIMKHKDVAKAWGKYYG